MPKHHCSVCEVSVISCIMKQGTKQLVGPTLSQEEKVGIALPFPWKIFHLPSPFALYSVKLTPL